MNITSLIPLLFRFSLLLLPIAAAEAEWVFVEPSSPSGGIAVRPFDSGREMSKGSTWRTFTLVPLPEGSRGRYRLQAVRPGNPDAHLSAGGAWLAEQFFEDTLPRYGSTPEAQDYLVQAAILEFQRGETTVATSTNPFTRLAVKHFGGISPACASYGGARVRLGMLYPAASGAVSASLAPVFAKGPADGKAILFADAPDRAIPIVLPGEDLLLTSVPYGAGSFAGQYAAVGGGGGAFGSFSVVERNDTSGRGRGGDSGGSVASAPGDTAGGGGTDTDTSNPGGGTSIRPRPTPVGASSTPRSPHRVPESGPSILYLSLGLLGLVGISRWVQEKSRVPSM